MPPLAPVSIDDAKGQLSNFPLTLLPGGVSAAFDDHEALSADLHTFGVDLPIGCAIHMLLTFYSLQTEL